MSKLVIKTEQVGGWTLGPFHYFWHIYSAEINISSNKPYSSRKKAKEAALEFINRCLMDYSTWPEDFR